ncbi:uncharacterized protein LOC108145553 isoform X1 [Drosophila elegans]|uniref:uncharacterized protein LOC108145553 isoform X1 n=2 Tax=Drosophila elegans TaxID=30023 RepID=UPI0007E8A66E|nr:uncharacterized protein LOC108145553 isoform X1 [Drosophila elegans]
MDILKCIDNKEIFIEVLHLAIDYLIGNINDKQTLRSSHKYGFHNAEDFLLVTRKMSSYYKLFSLEITRCKNVTPFTCITPELSRLVPIVLTARLSEVTRHLAQWEFSKTENIVESFGWDTRLILGDSSFGGNFHKITTVNFRYHNINYPNILFFEMNNVKLTDFIILLKNSLVQ